MSKTKDKTYKREGATYLQCPHCHIEHQVPMCVFAHYTSEYTVTCSDENGRKGCGEVFYLQSGVVWK